MENAKFCNLCKKFFLLRQALYPVILDCAITKPAYDQIFHDVCWFFLLWFVLTWYDMARHGMPPCDMLTGSCWTVGRLSVMALTDKKHTLVAQYSKTYVLAGPCCAVEFMISVNGVNVTFPHIGRAHTQNGLCCDILWHDLTWHDVITRSWRTVTGIARHRGFASLTHSKSQSCIVVTSAAAHGRIVKTVKKVTTYMVGTVKRQNTSSSERSWRKIAEIRQSLFRKSAWSGYAHKMCAVDSNTKRLYSNEMSDRATHFTVFMIMNCPVEQQILAVYGSIVDSRRTFARVSLYLNILNVKRFVDFYWLY